MKVLHECSRNIPGIDMQVYTYDTAKNKAWYINGFIIFYCPYCGIDLKELLT
jgi:hypothetical protein